MLEWIPQIISSSVLVGLLGCVVGCGSRGDKGPELAPQVVRVRTDTALSEHLQFARFSSSALKGNLIGDPHERELGVLLPPSYFRDGERRYPVVYLLHGLGRRSDGHLDGLSVQRAAYLEMERGRLAEMILVAVDGTTSFGGSYYGRSPTIGDFERYIVHEIVGLVDARYRTIPDASGRAIAGFSMGGQGAIKLVMKYPGVFSGVGSLSGSPFSLRYREARYRDALAGKKRPESLAELKSLYPFESAWTTASVYAKAAAFSPNPNRPPLYLDLPFEIRTDSKDPVWQRWSADDPVSLVATHHAALRSLRVIYVDHGDQEAWLGTDDFDRELMRYGLGHTHHVFRGGHSDDYEARHLRMLKHLTMAWEPGV